MFQRIRKNEWIEISNFKIVACISGDDFAAFTLIRISEGESDYEK